MSLIYFLVFSFGVIIGSFLNVVILRYNSGISVSGRSFCMSCNKKLSWYELIPILSFVFLKGKCRQCHTKISWQYPTIEIITGFLFLAIFLFDSSEILFRKILLLSVFGFQSSVLIMFHWIIFSILIVITVYDIKHKIIPDSLVFAFAGLSLLGLLLGFGPEINKLNLFSGLILSIPFALLWLVSQGKWIGLGDAKLALGIGWFMGFLYGISSIILAFWMGSLFGIFLVLLSKVQLLFFKGKHFTIKSEIPFAPFLIASLVLIFFFRWDLLSLRLFL